MKKIISLLIAITCVFALFSCSGKGDVKSFAAVVNSSAPTKITTQTSYSDSNNTLSGRFETTIYGTDFEMYYSYQDYAVPGAGMNPDEYIKLNEGTVYYKDGQFSQDGGKTWDSYSPDVNALNAKIVLNAKDIDEYTISDDGKTLEATLTAEQAEKMFGIKIDANEEDGVSVVIVHDGSNLRSIRITYSTKNASNVSIDTSYTYNAVSSPFEEETQPDAEE